jgi:hypothetical protein
MNNCWPVGIDHSLGKVDAVTATAEIGALAEREAH